MIRYSDSSETDDFSDYSSLDSNSYSSESLESNPLDSNSDSSETYEDCENVSEGFDFKVYENAIPVDIPLENLPSFAKCYVQSPEPRVEQERLFDAENGGASATEVETIFSGVTNIAGKTRRMTVEDANGKSALVWHPSLVNKFIII